MRKYLLPILLIGLAYAQNPCEDERYLRIKSSGRLKNCEFF